MINYKNGGIHNYVYTVFQHVGKLAGKNMYNKYKNCCLCPRKCGVDRLSGKNGLCGENAEIRVGRVALHYWEEPCISGEKGSGTVFFAGCNLKCIYCQNYSLSRSAKGIKKSVEELKTEFLKLQSDGAHNINLVTAEHFAPSVKDALIRAKGAGLKIPVILNSSGYVTEETLEFLKDVIDIYIVDFKYMSEKLSKEFSAAEDYPAVAKRALQKMTELQPKLVFEDETMKKGVIVRHLCLPGNTEDSKMVIKYIYDTYKDSVVLSVMSQYTPMPACKNHPLLKRKLSKKEYDNIIDFCIKIGVENAYIQEGDAASESFIPEFR